MPLRSVVHGIVKKLKINRAPPKGEIEDEFDDVEWYDSEELRPLAEAEDKAYENLLRSFGPPPKGKDFSPELDELANQYPDNDVLGVLNERNASFFHTLLTADAWAEVGDVEEVIDFYDEWIASGQELASLLKGPRKAAANALVAAFRASKRALTKFASKA